MTSRIWTALAVATLSSTLTVGPAVGAATPAPSPGTADAGLTQGSGDADQTAAKPKADPAVEKFWEAITLMKSRSPAERSAGFAALQKSADLEYTHAQLELGNCYMSGFNGMTKNPRKAVNFYRLAAERGNAFAMVSLGTCYFAGEGVSKDEAKAMQWLTAALAPNADFSVPTPSAAVVAAQLTATTDAEVAGTIGSDIVSTHQATAHFILGALYSQQKKWSEAQNHFVAAATAGPNGRSGIYAAAVAAAGNYAFGQGVPRDMEKASAMLARSKTLGTRAGISFVQNSVAMKQTDSFAAAEAEDKLTEALGAIESGVQLGIANSLADKKSKTYDITEATKWYEVAAENGQVWAMLPLAFIYYQGELGHPDPEKAFHWFEKAGSGERPKHYLAVANLAICYQNGIGTAKDFEKAAALFTKWRKVDIVCYLGSIGQCPTVPQTYEEELALNETWAKKKKDPQAQYLMGLRYTRGWGVNTDYETAKDWYKKAAKGGQADALNQLGELAEYPLLLLNLRVSSPKTAEQAATYYQQASAAGSSDGMANYARLLFTGIGVKQDTVKAEELYLRCVQTDPANILAHRTLGQIEENRLRTALPAHDEPAATRARVAMLEHYEAGKNLGDPVAASNLGIIYYDGELAPKDLRKAYSHFDDAATRGSATAHYALGLMLEHGEGVPVSLSEAAYHYRLAALEGNMDALRRLINFYLTGQGVSLDLDRALFWLQRLETATGNQQVLTTYCDVLVRKQAYEDALTLLKKLRKSSDPTIAGFANDRLATCYTEGWGVKADPAQAKKYHDQAVKLGNGDALTEQAMAQLKEGKTAEALNSLHRAAGTSRVAAYRLGLMYYNGENVAKNEAEGIKYLTLAADGNLTSALVFLANLTLNHASGAPSLDQAIEYARQAETNGRAAAGAVREELEKRRNQAEAGSNEHTRARAS